MTKTSRSVALASEHCTRTLWVCATAFLYLWLQNKIHFPVVAGTQTTWFSIRNEQQDILFDLKEFQMTKTSRSVALASIQCTRTLWVCATAFLYLWLGNKIHFPVVAGTQKTWFSVRNEQQNILFDLKEFQMKTTSKSVALASKQCNRTLWVCATAFLWLQNKIHFPVVAGTQTTWFSIRNEQQNILFKRVSDDNNIQVSCTSINTVY
jgi:hypothetical protein